MDYELNTTNKYHKEYLNTLGWELTICNSLYDDKGAIRKILIENESFGRLLYKHLNRFFPMDKIKKVLEIGGGYGYLMKDFLDTNSALIPTMIDISPYLIKKQQETLKNYKVTFIEDDFLLVDDTMLAGYDLVIMNENLGDFPTVVDLKREIFNIPKEAITDPLVKKIRNFFEKYSLALPEKDIFNFNLGAIEALEKLCRNTIPYIYIGEHSCEAQPPLQLRPFLNILPVGNPERISLMGHDEYTIKFSYLEDMGKFFGYNVIRGVFGDFIPFRWDKKIEYILATKGRYGDEDEMIYHFVEDLYKYEFLIFLKSDKEAHNSKINGLKEY